MCKIGENRLIPKGTYFWSITNQTTICSKTDEIVQITAKSYDGEIIFVKPMQVLYPQTIPGLITKGKDEWEIKYSETLSYNLPKPNVEFYF